MRRRDTLRVTYTGPKLFAFSCKQLGLVFLCTRKIQVEDGPIAVLSSISLDSSPYPMLRCQKALCS